MRDVPWISMSDIPGWTSPEYGGGASGISPVRGSQPAPNVEDFLDDVKPKSAMPESAALSNVARDVSASPTVNESSGGYDLNTVLIGGAVVIGGLILLTGGKGE